MLQLDRSQRSDLEARFAVSVASTTEEIEEVQRLRWQVFVEEQGARPEPGRHGIEADRFDPHCLHLVVRDLADRRAVGTYRVLMHEGARQAGSFYTEQEFDIGGLGAMRPWIVEIGRSCVHRDYRSGVVITLLWAGLAGLILDRDVRFIIGCASISMADGGREAASLYEKLRHEHLAPPALRMRPLNPLRSDASPFDDTVKPPPLIKGYLRAGAHIAGPPSVDVEFGTADLPMVLPLEKLSRRYARHFAGN